MSTLLSSTFIGNTVPSLLSSTLIANPVALSLVLLLLETLSPSLLSSTRIGNPVPLSLVQLLLETLSPSPKFYSYWKPDLPLQSSTLIGKVLPECINCSSHGSILKQGETLKISSF